MDILIRKMQRGDAEIVLDMMRRFYNSPALITHGSEEIFATNVENCLDDSICADGFIFIDGEKIIGYGITAQSYSTEFGRECVWIEDIYIAEEYRGRGIGSQFINFVKEHYPDKVLRLEASRGNDKALSFYKNLGFKELPYMEMVYLGG